MINNSVEQLFIDFRGIQMRLNTLLAFFLMVMSGLTFAETVSKAIVVQANGDKAQFEKVLMLTSNMRDVLTTSKFEVVVFGPAVKFLTDDSEELPLIQKVQSEGIKVIACGRSMQTDNVKETDLADGVKVTPFGAVYIVNRQKQGWQYFRP
jgi:intracellular sulfur oxidation DsrE/DsrF family protein